MLSHRSNVPTKGPILSTEAYVYSLQPSRSVNLHSYDPKSQRQEYVEVKIGGHALDYRQFTIPNDNISIIFKSKYQKQVRSTFGRNISRSYDTKSKEILEYAPTKIGGHAFDHVQFKGRGRPSRPLWGYEPRPYRNTIYTNSVPIRYSVYTGCGCEIQQVIIQAKLNCGHSICMNCLEILTKSNAKTFHCQYRYCHGKSEKEIVSILLSDGTIFHLPSTMTSKHWNLQSIATQLLKNTTFATAIGLALEMRHMNWMNRQKIGISTQLLTDISTPIPKEFIRQQEEARCQWIQRLETVPEHSLLHNYAFIQTLGKGQCAEVLLVKRQSPSQSKSKLVQDVVVLKESDQVDVAVNEIQILSKVKSRNVVQMNRYFAEKIGHKTFIYLEMEYCKRGDLTTLIQSGQHISDAVFDDIIYQICQGLRDIHACGIVHRDIKPENILLTENQVVKIADFGVSSILESRLMTSHAAGTIAYMAPEVRAYLVGDPVSYDMSADIWSLGVLCLAMLSGDLSPRVSVRPVNECIEELQEKYKIKDRHVKFIQSALHSNPKNRKTAEELMQILKPHPISSRL